MKRLLLGLAVLLSTAALAWASFPPARTLMAAWLPIQSILGQSGETAQKPPAKRGPPPAPVTVAAVAIGDMPVVLSAPGTVEPRATVAVKPRVDGQISEVLFKEGDLVKEGQVLFRFDDRLVKAQIKQAEANIKKDEATLADAKGIYQRRLVLIEKKIVSESAMDTAKATMESLKAAIAAGQAALEAQKTQLDYLVIVAPITGRTGSTPAKPGANVRAADLTALVTINQTQPVLVTFALPQTDMPALRRALAAKSQADIKILGDNGPSRMGTIEFIDNQVDKQTGTLTAKIIAPNADEALWPGAAVEVILTVEVKKDMLQVPASAVLPSQLGMITWVVGADNRAQPKAVVVERIVGQTAYLSGGVTPGERVVTDGQVRIAPGAIVSVQEPAGTAAGAGKSRSDAPKADTPKGAPPKAGADKGEKKKSGEDRRS